MKIRFYLDIWPGTSPRDINYANANPGPKMIGCRRFAFDVELPTHLLYDPDVVSPEVSGPIEIKDASHD